jgi:hypothetical protein
MWILPWRRAVLSFTALLGLAGGGAPRGAGDLPVPAPEEAATSADDAAIEAQPVCIASTVHSAGELGPALLYQRTRLPDGRLVVGYYAFFSEERPWGNNWLTWSLLPALALDLVYTRGLLVAPGLQRAAFGRADVEGFRVLYAAPDAGGDGHLRALGAVADDDRHRRADLGRADLFAVDPERITLVTDSWSHHLGAHGRRAEDLVYRRCYGPRSIRPLDREVVRRFHLERRARPAALDDVAAAAGDGVVNGEDDHRAHDRREEAPGRLVRRVDPQGAPEEAAQHRAGHAEERREHEAARLAPRREELGDHPDDQTEQDPQYDRHDAPPLATGCPSPEERAGGVPEAVASGLRAR